ncbi:hypothetical protein RI129_006293 [Pyrocoelia pectoralis]|uniref:MADF domain-containing protein n=1 Tax=Pyrocoelia pectoralis TaxID=417401 RepID=A0AAN7ZNI7_9COLE
MDVEKLISLVNNRKPLWDMTDKSYHMRDSQRKLWQEVAVEINANVDVVKNKWRGLRDTFRREFNKAKKYKSGDGAASVVTPKWPYFKMLLFLSNTVDRRKLHGNTSPQMIGANNSDSEAETMLEAVDNTDSQSIISETSQQISNSAIQQPSTSGTKATSSLSEPTSTIPLQPNKKTNSHLKYKKSEKQAMDEKFLQIERAKLDIYSRRQNADSEYQFLMSLLPFLTAVPKHRQMMVRTKMQQIFIEEEQLLTIHAPGASYRSYEETSTPSPMYRNSDSSRTSCYSNQLIPLDSPIPLTVEQSSEIPHYSIERRDISSQDISPQQSLSIQTLLSEFTE